MTAQNEAMSARNAQLEIENESLKNELQNSRADYTTLQVDMNDVRDYYHQIDIVASKMGHRCEVRRHVVFSQLRAFCDKDDLPSPSSGVGILTGRRGGQSSVLERGWVGQG